MPNGGGGSPCREEADWTANQTNSESESVKMTAPVAHAKAKPRPDGGRNDAFTKVKAKPKPRSSEISSEDIQCPTCWQTFRGNAETLRRHENTDPTCLQWRDWLNWQDYDALERSGDKKDEKPAARAASCPARAASAPARAAGPSHAPAPLQNAAAALEGDIEKTEKIKGPEKIEPKEDKKKTEKNEKPGQKLEKKPDQKKQKKRRPTPSPRARDRTRARRRDPSTSSADANPGRGLKVTRMGARSIMLTFS